MTPGKLKYDIFDEAVRQFNELLKGAGKDTVKVSRTNGRRYDDIRADVKREWGALLGYGGTVTIGQS